MNLVSYVVDQQCLAYLPHSILFYFCWHLMNLSAKKKLGQVPKLLECPLIGFCAFAVWLVPSEFCVLLWANIYQPIHENQISK